MITERIKKSKRSTSVMKIFTAALALLLGNSASAEFKMTDVDKMDFRASGIYLNNSAGDSFSGELSWNPSYSINPDWTVRGNVGLSPQKGTSETFIMSEFGLLGGYKINQAWEVEVGAGLQSWSNESTASMVNLNVLWNMGAPLLGYFERIFAGYSLVNQEKVTNEIKIGVTMTFGSVTKGGVNVTK